MHTIKQRVGWLRGRSFLAGLIVLVSLAVPLTALAAPTFTTDNFKQKWERADKAVADNKSNPARSWVWGPEGFIPAGGDTEPYADSPGGRRQVQYFDKARMELNNPTNGQVTNGLLVRELISGQLATGDRAATPRLAADIPVAGDAVNNDGPTYASFAKVASLNLDNPATNRSGQNVTDSIDKSGKLGTSADLGSKAKYVYFEGTLKHNIPDVFWSFMNQTGNVYENGQYKDIQPVLGSNPAAPWLDATGYPITEPYWAKVTVGQKVTDVLIQAFERRVLTFTPTNSAQYQVEMGNVGRHYFTWRYNTRYDIAPPTPNPTPRPGPTPPPGPIVNSCKDLPDDAKEVVNLIRCGPAGMQVIVLAEMQAKEAVNIIRINSDGTQVQVGSVIAADNGFVDILYNTSSKSLGYLHYRLVGTQSGKNFDFHLFLDPPRTSPTILSSTNSGKASEPFAFAILGFSGSEQIVYDFKSPNGKEFKTSNITVSATGSLTILIFPDLVFKGDAVPGDWTITAVSSTDGSRYAGIHFTITP